MDDGRDLGSLLQRARSEFHSNKKFSAVIFCRFSKSPDDLRASFFKSLDYLHSQTGEYIYFTLVGYAFGEKPDTNESWQKLETMLDGQDVWFSNQAFDRFENELSTKIGSIGDSHDERYEYKGGIDLIIIEAVDTTRGRELISHQSYVLFLADFIRDRYQANVEKFFTDLRSYVRRHPESLQYNAIVDFLGTQRRLGRYSFMGHAVTKHTLDRLIKVAGMGVRGW